MNNRNEIKWTPFESLFQTKDVIQELVKKKSLHEKPVLSEDELLEYNRILGDKIELKKARHEFQ